VADAQRAESAGFDFVSSNDHPGGAAPNFETWTMLTWMAAATPRIKVASRVLGVPYRSPAMVAKMAESLDGLMIHPITLGTGKRLFKDGNPKRPLRLTRSTTSSTGVVIASYEPVRSEE
jgi:hypothetical protein